MNFHSTLEPHIWIANKLNPKVRKDLLQIANSFIKNSEVELHVKDIILTGSICSYSYHSGSDIDCHLIFDFKSIDENIILVKNYLLTKVGSWNERHNITIHGFKVELYTEDLMDKNISNGIYSVLKNKWLEVPIRQSNVEIDDDKIDSFVFKVMKKIDEIDEYFILHPESAKRVNEITTLIKDRLRSIRKKSLEKYGIYGPGNLIFKKLRDNGYLKKLSDLAITTYDEEFTEK